MVAAIILLILAVSFLGLSFMALRAKEDSYQKKSSTPKKIREEDIIWGVNRIREENIIWDVGGVQKDIPRVNVGDVYSLERVGYTAYVTNKGVDNKGNVYIKYTLSTGLTEGYCLSERVLLEEEFLRCYTTFKKD